MSEDCSYNRKDVSYRYVIQRLYPYISLEECWLSFYIGGVLISILTGEWIYLGCRIGRLTRG